MNGDFRVDGTNLTKYSGEDEEVRVPEGITKINESAFWGMKNVKSVILPGTIETVEIGSRPWYMGGKRQHAGIGVYKIMPEWSPDTIGSLSDSVAELLKNNWLNQMKPRSWSVLYLTQNTEEFAELFRTHMEDKPNEYFAEMIKLLKEGGNEKMLTNAAYYAAGHHKELKRKFIEELYLIAKSKEETESAREILDSVINPKKLQKNSRYAWLYEKFDEPKLKNLYRDLGGDDKALDEVLSFNRKEYVPEIAVLAAVIPYTEFFDEERRASYTSSKVKILEDSDRAAAMTDRASLLTFIRKNTDIKKNTRWLYPYCRYGREHEIEELISKRKETDLHVPRAVYRGVFTACVLPSNALMLSDCYSAKLALYEGKKYINRTAAYAQIRGETEDAVLTDIGLDENGEIFYDLGSEKISACLTDDFKLKLTAEKSETALSELPEGANYKLYRRAKADLKRREEYLTEAVKIRTERLLRDFLSGKAVNFEEWKHTNFATAINKKFAELLVWAQRGKTFTVKGGRLINCDAREYIPSEAPIRLAHPMEMNKEDVCAWHNYFKESGIEQPFVQIEEPICNLDEIKEDRYMSAVIPLYKFMSRSADGIIFNDLGYSMCVELNDCAVKYELYGSRSSWSDYNGIEIYKFAPAKYSRQANHIVSLLDEWAAEEFVKKDDFRALELAANASAQQLEKYTGIAIENEAKNLTAKLLSIKNERFPESREFSEFSLGDW